MALIALDNGFVVTQGLRAVKLVVWNKKESRVFIHYEHLNEAVFYDFDTEKDARKFVAAIARDVEEEQF